MTDTVAEHIAALRDDDWGIREEAALALAECGDPRSVRPLIAALRDDDRAVTAAAARALTAIGAPAVEDVAVCLRDPNVSVQEAAASILSETADARALDPLASALESSNWVIRMFAVRAVGRLDAAHDVEQLDAARDIGRLNAPRPMETLVRLLQDTVPAVRDEVVAVLTAFGEAAVAPLVDELTHRDWRVRLRAVESLCVLKSPTAVPALTGLLRDDPDTAVRQEAARALGETGAGAVDHHAGAAATDATGTATATATTAARRPPMKNVGGRHSAPSTPLDAETSVRGIHPKEVIGRTQQQTMQQKDGFPIKNVGNDGRVGHPAVGATTDAAVADADAAAAATVAGDATHAVADAAVATATGTAVATAATTAAGDALLAVIDEPALQVRAIEALGKLGDRRVAPFLFRLLGALTPGEYANRTPACEENESARTLAAAEEAVRALARLRDERAVPVLIHALHSPLLRGEAAAALVRFGPPVVAPLVEQLQREHDDNIRRHITDTLTQLGWNPNRVRLASPPRDARPARVGD